MTTSIPPPSTAELLSGRVTIALPTGTRELDDDAVVIGRDSSSCDVVLDGVLVSRRHARISATAAAVILEDLGSTNGVLVNGRRVGRNTVALRDGDRITIGTFELVVFPSDPITERPRCGARAAAAAP
jgi:pSer/pThr/pTyr-binding forkhead associated (FHA) protein